MTDLIKKFKRLKRNIKRVSQKEADVAVYDTIKFGHNQVKSRPRLRLAAKVVLGLMLVFLVSRQISSVIAQKKADLVVNGQRILVTSEVSEKPETVIVQKVDLKRSPFETRQPVDGYISQGFRFSHRATDIAASYGSAIHPLGAGRVIFAGRVFDGHGNVVIIDHGDNFKSAYAHLDKIYVGVGNTIETETTIGTVGMTGRTTGPHVHLEVYDNEVAIDPATIFP